MRRTVDNPGWDRQTIPDGPHGWIQWKGTDVCMDIHCPCGFDGHIDTDFAYYYRCLGCGTPYMINGHVEMVPLTPKEAESVDTRFKTDTTHGD